MTSRNTKPRSVVWGYYTETPDNKHKCSFCGEVLSSNSATRLRTHIMNACALAPEDAKNMCYADLPKVCVLLIQLGQSQLYHELNDKHHCQVVNFDLTVCRMRHNPTVLYYTKCVCFAAFLYLSFTLLILLKIVDRIIYIEHE